MDPHVGKLSSPTVRNVDGEGAYEWLLSARRY
jgi:hypothetical protein